MKVFKSICHTTLILQNYDIPSNDNILYRIMFVDHKDESTYYSVFTDGDLVKDKFGGRVSGFLISFDDLDGLQKHFYTEDDMRDHKINTILTL